ncbi:DUF6894 family protein [Rhodopseudomonas sp. B29]|uniref:DUF6894 family protein n=1 Tax=Rhodopseudomonas sp. B29 TaxID=95607 RepID=UPI00034B4E5F|nr:hypothetical protein [Rhodopseudomonas sp. B29]
MPRFFFNYTSGGTTSVDDIGVDFPSLEAAYLDACESALEIAFEQLQARQDPTGDAFDIFDDKQNVLIKLPFSEVLRPAGRPPVLANLQTEIALENCSREIARGEKLNSELGAELARTKELFAALRANLSLVSPS